jgi:hypothetical protein
MSFMEKAVPISAMLLLCLCIGGVFGQSDEGAATAALAEADARATTVFELLRDAEEVGGNVSVVREALNEVCGWLATAQAYHRSGNFSGALAFAELAIERAVGLEIEALELANSAAVEHGRRLSSTLSVSVAGAILVPLAGFLGWRYVKAWFVRRLGKMKPEVRDVDEPE